MAIPDLLKSCPLFFELYDKEIEKIKETIRKYEEKVMELNQQIKLQENGI